MKFVIESSTALVWPLLAKPLIKNTPGFRAARFVRVIGVRHHRQIIVVFS